MDSGLFQLQRLVSTLLGVLVQLALLGVALAVVRPRRPRAGALLAGAAGMLLAGMLAWQVVYQLAARLLGASGYASVFGWVSLAQAVWSAVAWALLILAVLELARPAPAAGPGAAEGGGR